MWSLYGLYVVFKPTSCAPTVNVFYPILKINISSTIIMIDSFFASFDQRPLYWSHGQHPLLLSHDRCPLLIRMINIHSVHTGSMSSSLFARSTSPTLIKWSTSSTLSSWSTSSTYCNSHDRCPPHYCHGQCHLLNTVLVMISLCMVLVRYRGITTLFVCSLIIFTVTCAAYC